jgi:hypothetical protein
MPARVGLPRPRRPRGKDIAAGAVVLLFVISILVVGTGFFIAHELQPTDGRFGVPQYLVFPLCGRDYHISNLPEVNAPAVDGAFVVEPTIGSIPLLSLLTCPKNSNGLTYTVIWLHVGPDEFASYALEGGP